MEPSIIVMKDSWPWLGAMVMIFGSPVVANPTLLATSEAFSFQ